ncbi:MAG: FkbM family methyltransferase [Xanthobacteraceae bacterium]
MTLVDVGANGLFTIAGAHKVGPTGKVLAFEPSKREYQNLDRNIALNKFDNVVAMQCGVLDVEGCARFYEAEPEFSGLSSFAEIDAIDFKTLPNLRVAWSSVLKKDAKVLWFGLSDREILIRGVNRSCLEIKIYSGRFSYKLSGIEVELTPLDKLFCFFQWAGARLLADKRSKWNTELMRRVKPLLLSTKGNVTAQVAEGQNEDYIRISGGANSEFNFRLRTIVGGAKQIVISGEGERLVEPECYEVDCVKLDDVCERSEVQRIDVVKIDVEGAEMAVLKGASSIIRKYKPLLIIELSDKHLVRQGSSVSEVAEFLRAERYTIVDVDGGQCAVVDLPLPREGDFVAVHEDKLVELRRVLASPPSS